MKQCIKIKLERERCI